jgi:hypothetical protein
MPLPDLCDIPVSVRVAAYANTAGARTQTFTATTLNAAIQPMSAKAKVDHSLDQGDVAYAFYFESDPGVKKQDRITWGAKSLVVTAPAQDQAGLGRLYKVIAREIE